MGTFFFFLTIFVIPGFPAGALVGRWALVACVSAALLYRCELSKGAWALLAYLAVMTWWGPIAYEAVPLYLHAIFFTILYCYAKGMPDLRKVAIGVGLGIGLNSAFVIAQHFAGLAWIPEITPDGGLYYNKNIATETAAMALVLVLGYRLWWVVPGILPTLVWGSRSPAIALGVVGALALWQRSKWLAVGALLGPVVIADLWLQAHGSTIYAGSFDTLQQRFGTWYDGAHGFTILGQGLGSWIVNFPLYQSHTSALELRWENAHNDFVQIIFELGIVGAVLVAAFLSRLAIAERKPEFYALVAFLVMAVPGFPLYQPVTGALAAVCAGHLFGDRYRIYHYIANVGLSVWRRYAGQTGNSLRAGVETVPVQSGPAFGPGLSYYHSTRLSPPGLGGGGVAE